MVQTDLSSVSLLFNRYGGIKRRGREANYPSSSSDEFKNEGRYTSSSPIRLFGVDKENFTFS